MITCQHEWVQQCQIKYRYESLPEGEHWEDAHYPVPECLGGTETVRLWSRDHAVHGYLQSEDLDQVCFHGYRRKTDRRLIEKHYPEYLELSDRWFIEAQKRAFKAKLQKNPDCQSESASKVSNEARSKGGVVSGKDNVILQRGIFDLSYISSEDYLSDKSRGGKNCVEKEAGMHNPDYKFSPKRIEDCRKGGVKGGNKTAQSQVGILSPEYLDSERRKEDCRKGGAISATKLNSQKWMDPDHPELGVTNAGALVGKQKAKGYPHGKENRVKVG